MTAPDRRSVIAGAASAAALSPLLIPLARTADWSPGVVRHIAPTVSASAFRIKISLSRPTENVRLLVDDAPAKAARSDVEGRFWRFQIDGLAPAQTYRLELKEGRRALCDPWPLRTFPAPDAEVQRFRLLSFTCAGGLEGAKSVRGIEAFRPLAIRQMLLDRGLAFAPDAVIANGDHIYWDQRAWLEHPNAEIRRLSREAYDRFGYFDRVQSVIGGANEDLLKRLADPQIAELYGVRLRSTPSFFVRDDHDYFENDDATADFVTFPPDDFQIRAANALQRLYYPEFLPDPTRPVGLSGVDFSEGAVSTCFGSLRFGKLFEAALYDCGGYLTLKGDHAGLVPPEVEAWLLARTRTEDTRHFAHIPSHPMGWSAGKWREWYPDVVAAPGDGDVVVSTHGAADANLRLTNQRAKFFWQRGWHAQHQRLVQALSAQKQRAALMLSGDLHAIGWGAIRQSGDLDLSANPVRTVLSGPISTSGAGWPTFARGTLPQAPAGMSLDQNGPVLEKNGFTLIDVERDRIIVRLFAWREPDPIAAIATLEPYETLEIRPPHG